MSLQKQKSLNIGCLKKNPIAFNFAVKKETIHLWN